MLPELRDYVKSIPKIKDQFFDLLRMDVKEVATDFINGVMSAEFELFIGRAKHERQSLISVSEKNYCNGHYQRTFMAKGLGKLSVKVPRDRSGVYKTDVLDKYQRTETALKEWWRW
jgi:transposase-like protein